MSSFSVLSFSSDGTGEDWFANGYQYHNITNTASGEQTFQLRSSTGVPLGNTYNIKIDFQTSKYVVTDVGGAAPHYFHVGSSIPSSFPSATTVDLINSTDSLYIFQGQSNIQAHSVLDLQGPVTGGGTSSNSSSSTQKKVFCNFW
jgi:hypothetical protein